MRPTEIDSELDAVIAERGAPKRRVALRVADIDYDGLASAHDVARYLSTRGWMAREPFAKTSLWYLQVSDVESFSAVIPTEESNSYTWWLKDAVRDIATAERRKPAEVLRDIEALARSEEHTQPTQISHCIKLALAIIADIEALGELAPMALATPEIKRLRALLGPDGGR
jgi:hypothetical protein